MSKVGAPTIYTEELADEICNEIACTSDGLPTLCKKNKNWPSRKVIHQWIIRNKTFGDKYARAKQLQVDVLVDEIFEMLKDESKDFCELQKGKKSFNHAHFKRLEKLVDATKWKASKLAPKIYGDKLQHEGSIGLRDESTENVRKIDDKYYKNY